MAQPGYTFVKGIYVDTRTGKPYLPKRIADVLDPMKQRVKGIKEVKPLKRTDSQRAELLRLEKEIHKIELRAAESLAATSTSRAAYYRSKHPTGPPGEKNIPSEEAYRESLRKAGLKNTETYRETGISRSRDSLPALLRLVQSGLLTLEDIENPALSASVARILKLETPTKTKSYDTDEMQVKRIYWRDGLRIEPYDPDATDADGDGVVQEGTAWERPANTTMVDELGAAIQRGATSGRRNLSHRVVDKDGNTVKYDKPLNPAPAASKRASQKPKKWSTPLGRSGWPSLRELGHQTILQVFSAAHSRDVLASMPGPDQSREWAKLPRRATATRTSAAERTAEDVAENLRSLIQRMRYPENARILSDEISESMIGRRISPHTDQMLEAYRMRIESVTRRFGPIVTKGQAKEALAKAFPNLLNDIQELQFRRWGMAATGHTWPFDSEEMTLRQRNWVMSLLHSSMERPDIAANVIAIEHINDPKQKSNADAALTFGLTGKGVDVKFGYSIRLQEGAYENEEVRFAAVFQKAAEVAGLLKAEQSDPHGWHAQLLRRVRAGSNQLTDWVAGNRETIDMMNDPNISNDEARGFHAFRLGLHEWGHLTDFAARLEDIGVDLSDDNQDLEWFVAKTQLEYGQFPGQALKSFSTLRADLLLEHSRKNGAVAYSRVGDGGHFLHIFTGYTPADEETDYDNLSTRQVITLERIMHSLVSQYSGTNYAETTAEFASATSASMDLVMRFAETPEEVEALVQFYDWLSGNGDQRHDFATNPVPENVERSMESAVKSLLVQASRRLINYESDDETDRIRLAHEFRKMIEAITEDHLDRRDASEVVLRMMSMRIKDFEVGYERTVQAIIGSIPTEQSEQTLVEAAERAVKHLEDGRILRSILRDLKMLEGSNVTQMQYFDALGDMSMERGISASRRDQAWGALFDQDKSAKSLLGSKAKKEFATEEDAAAYFDKRRIAASRTPGCTGYPDPPVGFGF